MSAPAPHPPLSYFVVEGPHDQWVLARVLGARGAKVVRSIEREGRAGAVPPEPVLDPAWERLVPRTYPHQGDLLARVPHPLFLRGGDAAISVAIDAVSLDSNFKRLVRRLETTLAVVEGLERIGVVLDSDAEPPERRFERLRSDLAKGERARRFPLPSGLGEIASDGRLCFGIFAMPDNRSHGTLEDVLLQCAEASYPELRVLAEKFVEGACDLTELTDEDRKDLKKPAGPRKAEVSAIASVLRPGKALQVSIQDNRWIDERTLALPRLEAFAAFAWKIAGP